MHACLCVYLFNVSVLPFDTIPLSARTAFLVCAIFYVCLLSTYSTSTMCVYIDSGLLKLLTARPNKEEKVYKTNGSSFLCELLLIVFQVFDSRWLRLPWGWCARSALPTRQNMYCRIWALSLFLSLSLMNRCYTATWTRSEYEIDGKRKY